MNKPVPLFPRPLVSFLNLPGPYGSLDVIARSAHGIEFGFSDSDFVVLDRRQWEVLRHAVDLVSAARPPSRRGDEAGAGWGA